MTFGDSEESPSQEVQEPPFRVFLDNPSQFYSLEPEPPKSRVVSTDLSEFSEGSVFDQNLNMADPDPDVLDQPDVKNGLKTVKLEFSEMVELYNPDGYSAATLRNNKSEWISDVKASFNKLLEFTSEIGSRPDATDNDGIKIANEVKVARESFKKFLSDFNDKCNVATPQEAVNRADVPVVNNATQEEKKRVAKIEADIEAEKVSAGVKKLKEKIDVT